MTIDLSRLSPAPWDTELCGQRSDDSTHYVLTDADGRTLFDTSNSDAAEIEEDFDESGGVPYHVYRDAVGRTNIEFAALARNAFAAQEEFKLHAVYCGAEWRVPHLVFDLCLAVGPTSVEALASAGEWCRENPEVAAEMLRLWRERIAESKESS